jgi:ABC-type transport system involved in multi-copper enzyme maturation permease subunit
MRSQSWTQLLAVIRLEMKKTFFARRGLWVYLLAAAPVLLFLGHSIDVPIERQRLMNLAAGHPVPTANLHAIRRGMTIEEVVKRLGQPYSKRSFVREIGSRQRLERTFYRYTDGLSEYRFVFDDGDLTSIRYEEPETLKDTTLSFAALFQYFDLRVAVFFGCVGIFTNLFRGEMLDKSLHYYLLTPMRRELLVAGKYLAALIATVTIFTLSTALQLPAMLMQFKGAEISAYLHAGGWGQFAAYLGVTALACAAYGSLFMCTGLIFRNPIIPAAVILLWESVNLFLPTALKKISLTFYLQSLCPVLPPPDESMSLPLRLMVSAVTPATTSVAISGVVIFTIILLTVAAARARKLEINYSTE